MLAIMSSLGEMTVNVSESKVRFHAPLIAVMMFSFSGMGEIWAHDRIESSKVDARIEAFALDGGTKMELIDGMEESEVIEQLKVVRSRYDAIYAYGDSKAMNADEALLRMGDEETILRLMDQYHKGEGHGESVLMAANEKALKYLIEDVRSGSKEWRRRASDSWALPIRNTSAGRLLNIVEHCAAFPQDTRKWADSIETTVMGGLQPSSETALMTVLTWWEKNEKAINEGQYADATWLPAAAGKSSPEGQRKPRRQGDDERHGTSDAGIADDGLLLEKGQDAARNMNSGAKLALYLVGVAILIFIIWIFLKAKTRRKMGNNL
jgi:hypothetical protein